MVDVLSEDLGIPLRKRLLRPYARGAGAYQGVRLMLARPLTFMNASGSVAPRILREGGFSLPELLVVFDSLDISPGSCRLRLRGSPGGHKGMESVTRWLGSEDFMRLAVGIGRPAAREEVVEHVLGVPEGPAAAALEAGVRRAAEAVLLLLSGGPERAMNEINRKEPAS